MAIRKLQSTGGSSYTITLPKEWIQKNKLKSQSDIEVVEINKNLVLSASPKPVKVEKIKIDISQKKPDHLKREIVAHYLAGSNKLDLTSNKISKTQSLAVHNILPSLIGFELVVETQQLISIRNIFDPKKFPIISNVDKMFSMASAMVHDAIAAFRTGNKSLAKTIIERDSDIDKLYFALFRQCQSAISNKITVADLDVSLSQLKHYSQVGLQIERIADHAAKIASLTNNKINSKSISQIVEHSQQLINLLQTLQQQQSTTIINKVHSTLDTLNAVGLYIKKLIDSPNTLSHEDILLDSLDRISGYLQNIAELTIDLYIVESQNPS